MTHGWPGKRLVAEPSDPKDGAEREVAFVPRVSGFAPMSVHVPSCVERFSWEQTKDRYVAVKLGLVKSQTAKLYTLQCHVALHWSDGMGVI